MIWKPVQLILRDEEAEKLKADNALLHQHLEAGEPLQSEPLDNLLAMLSYLVNNVPELRKELDAAIASQEKHSIILIHPDSEILSLPWQAAIDEKTGRRLGDIPNLYINKLLPVHSSQRHVPPALKSPAPLKVLVAISCPEDAKLDIKRIFQQQEVMLMNALTPLIEKNEADVHFANTTSFESLKKLLAENHYHMLYFAGQGILLGGEAHIILENADTLTSDTIHGKEFADILKSNPEYQIPAVVLSLCQMREKGTETALRGLSRHFIKAGTSAVVAMGGAMELSYAISFAREYIAKTAQKWPDFLAFDSALKYIRKQEYQIAMQAREENPLPLQWILPNLYSSGKIHNLGNWDAAPVLLQHHSYRFASEEDRQIKRQQEQYRFIGRREELRQLWPHLEKKEPVLLEGPSGIGKTALAQRLVERLRMDEENLVPFIFGEKTKAVQDILNIMQNFLLMHGDMNVLAKIQSFETGKEIFTYLLYEIAKKWQPVFIFDNLEDFQSAPGEAFEDRFQGIAEIIHFLCHIKRFNVIMMNQYGMPDFPEVKRIQIHAPQMTDFWKKCYDLSTSQIVAELADPAQEKLCVRLFQQPKATFLDVVKLLYKNLGGNYRALELFSVLIEEKPAAAIQVLLWLEKVYEVSELEDGRIPSRAGVGLVFPHLINILDVRQLLVLKTLGQFNIPVQISAVLVQISPEDTDKSAIEEVTAEVLDKLFDMELLEIYTDQKTQAHYYYLTPTLRRALTKQKTEKAALVFQHEFAGEYHENCYKKSGGSLTELKEAFHHYSQTKRHDKVLSVGSILSDFYESHSMRQVAFYFAWQIYKRLGQKTPIAIWYRIAEILAVFGKYDDALSVYKNLLARFEAAGDMHKASETLGYMGNVFRIMEVHDTALLYLEQSLEISKKMGHRHIEADTLTTMSHLYIARGDHPTALPLAQEALNLKTLAGDLPGKRQLLMHLSEIMEMREEPEEAARHLVECVKICRELGDKRGECANLNTIARIYRDEKDYKISLRYLEASLKVCRDIGDKYIENEILKSIMNIMDNHMPIGRAMILLEEGLQVSREIGDRLTESQSLAKLAGREVEMRNVASAQKRLEKAFEICNEHRFEAVKCEVLYHFGIIMRNKGDHVNAIRYLNESLQIGKDVDYRSGVAKTLHALALIVYSLGDLLRASHYLKQSIDISNELKEKKIEALKLIDMANFYLDARVYELETAKRYLADAVKINVILRDEQITKILQDRSTFMDHYRKKVKKQ